MGSGSTKSGTITVRLEHCYQMARIYCCKITVALKKNSWTAAFVYSYGNGMDSLLFRGLLRLNRGVHGKLQEEGGSLGHMA